jgi:ribonuclease BN (tRNA processing enzyme)
MKLQFIGCGDAFGSGGRFNTCFHVTGNSTVFLIDCGATSVVGLKRLGIDANGVDLVLVTHFHGDHFGGLPFFLLEAQMGGKRERPLTIAGPPGLKERLESAMDVAFPGSPQQPTRFSLTLQELSVGKVVTINGIEIAAYPVVHTETAGPCFGYRMRIDGKVLAYSGDTEWTESLVEIGRDADLLICECYTYEKKVKHHTDFLTLKSHLPRISSKRLVLTHMSADMLAQRHHVSCETAEDGLVLEL